MARTPTPTPPAPAPEAAAEAAMAATDTPKRVFDWSALESSVAMPTRTPPPPRKVDAIAETPEPIRIKAEMALAKSMLRIKRAANSTATRKRIDPAWECQPVADAEMGAEFVRLLVRYCKYRPATGEIPHRDSESPMGQLTARCGDVAKYVKAADGIKAWKDGDDGEPFLGVRYSVKPFERRQDTSRLPGTAA